MKKILLTLALAAFAFTANAQFVVGGNVGIDHSSRANDDYSRGTTNTNISILPKVGYQLNDQMQVGIQLGWDYNYNRWYGASAPSGAIGATDYASDSYESNPSSAIVLKPYSTAQNDATVNTYNLPATSAQLADSANTNEPESSSQLTE